MNEFKTTDFSFEVVNLYSLPNIISHHYKEDKMGRAYSSHRRDEKCIQICSLQAQRQDLSIDEKIILIWILKKLGMRVGVNSPGSTQG
jgi:hypothetical protein